MGWRSRETMAIYLKTMNKRKVIEAVLADEEEQEQETDSIQAPASDTRQSRQPSSHDSSTRPDAEGSSMHDDDEFGWYEDEV